MKVVGDRREGSVPASPNFASPDFRRGPEEFGLAGTLALPRLGLFHTRAGGHGVGPHLDALLVLLGRLGRVLPLDEGLLDDPGGLVRRDRLAAFERARAGAAGDKQRKREPDAQEPGEVIRGRGTLGCGTTNPEPWMSPFLSEALGFGLCFHITLYRSTKRVTAVTGRVTRPKSRQVVAGS